MAPLERKKYVESEATYLLCQGNKEEIKISSFQTEVVCKGTERPSACNESKIHGVQNLKNIFVTR